MNIRPTLIAGVAALVLSSGFASAAQAHDRGHHDRNHHPSYRGSARVDRHYHKRGKHHRKHFRGCGHHAYYRGHQHHGHAHRYYRHPHVSGGYHYRHRGHDGLSLHLRF